MDILVIGSGGREHALIWKLKQCGVDKIYCAGENAGIAEMAECIDIPSGDCERLAQFAKRKHIDLTIVGPEVPLTLGVVDVFESEGLRIFGPSKKAAILEGSKVFTKDLLKKYSIPSGDYHVFDDRESAVSYIKKLAGPVVVKADGLAAGKGVILAETTSEAIDAVDLIMSEKSFGDAGNAIVVEEYLRGEEASFLAFTDGKTVIPLPSSQDHKAVYDGDKGPNTGGMGAYSPAPILTDELAEKAMTEVMIPTVKAMAAEGRPYKGILYAGLMINNGELKVLEFNCRFGDPEAQPLLMRLKSDLVDVLNAVVDEKLDQVKLEIDPRPAVCVVMSAGGYPGSYERGKLINGLAEAAKEENITIFHAGTVESSGKICTSGGRVLGVCALGEKLDKAISTAYRAVKMIDWENCYYRTDIGSKALMKNKSTEKKTLVGVVMGSDSDLPVIDNCIQFFKKIGIDYEITVASAHRSPERAAKYARTAKERGLKVIIAGAGMAAHLAGVLAAHTTLPVIGVPIDSSALKGMDALLSTVQMPPGIPVATMGIGKAGAKNAAILACQMIALSDPELAEKLEQFKVEMASQVEEKAKKIEVI
jgi:phosphoribosylamine---glycine ligase